VVRRSEPSISLGPFNCLFCCSQKSKQISFSALVGVREQPGKARTICNISNDVTAISLHRSTVLWRAVRADTLANVSPKTFLVLLQQSFAESQSKVTLMYSSAQLGFLALPTLHCSYSLTPARAGCGIEPHSQSRLPVQASQHQDSS
jgi:hypothetical protein